jgi:DNA-binding response OmpR family regulator
MSKALARRRGRGSPAQNGEASPSTGISANGAPASLHNGDNQPAPSAGSPLVLQAGSACLDLNTREFYFQGERICLLTKVHFVLLRFLMENAGRTFHQSKIQEELFPQYADSTSVLREMVRLKAQLGHARDCIENVRGSGYRFVSIQ